MDLATGAMASLLPKLFELLNDEYNLQTGTKRDVELLEREMRSMDAALRKVATVPRHQLDEHVKIWAGDVRDLSYEIEDVVDGFLVRVQGPTPAAAAADPDSFKGFLKKVTRLFSKAKARRQIADAIKDIKDKVKEVATRRDRYRVDNIGANPAYTSIVHDPRMPALFKDQRQLIGIDEPRDEIIRGLAEGDYNVYSSNQQIKMLSIFGFGGLGKTTLAKAVYDKIHPEFVHRAFLSVGQNPDLKKVLMGILLQIDNASGLYATMLDEEQILRKIRGLLENTRYLFVIDDIWDIKSWEVISCIWVDNDCGSVIITTTRILKVAEEISDHVYKHIPLSDDNSRELFFERLSISKCKHSYDLSVEISEKILQKCGGVPLAIITIASVLARKPREDWSDVYDSIGFGHEDNIQVDNTRNILLYSYYDLPCYLRTCLLHLSIYPEDYQIPKYSLIWKWVAEGFIHEKPPGLSLFEVGERYYNELINRSMIQPVENLYRGIIYACRVHDLVLDMIYSLSKEENFVLVILGSNPEQHTYPDYNNARRLSIQKRVTRDPMDNKPMPKVRSFIATMCHLGTMPLLSSFHGLRVLAIEGCTFMNEGTYHLEHLGMLLQLRYLGVSRTPIKELPSEVGNLKFLQTLYLRNTKISKLPRSIGLLRQLKCLHLPYNFKGASNWIGNLTSLEQLVLDDDASPEFLKELGKLTELRHLWTTFNSSDARLFRDLMACLGSLHRLHGLQIASWRQDRVRWADCDEGYDDVAHRHLRLLALSVVKLPRLPMWIDPSRMPGLSHLELLMETVEARGVEILGRFPELSVLELMAADDGFFLLDIAGGGAFPRLRFFYTNAMLRFGKGAMPNLETVDYSVGERERDWNVVVSLSSDIATVENLPCLQSVKVTICGFKEEVEAAFRHAVEIHPKRPALQTR